MSAFDRIPLVDLAAQHDEVALEVAAGFDKVLSSTAFVGGPDVDEFESEFAAYSEREACVGVANGTDAIELVVRALDIGPGDEVVVPANTFIATAEAVARAGASVVLADCDPVNLLIDPADVARRLTDRTRAVIGVDLYGQIAPMEELRDVLDGRDIHLLEDAAQSQGARRHGRTIGSVATAAMTSFYPGKNLGAYGDGGAVVTDDEELATRIRTIGSHGGLRRYEHVLKGFNSRLDTLQAVVLRAKLARLEGWNERRRAAAARYHDLLADVGDVRLPATDAPNLHVWHLYVVRVPNREGVLAHLNEAGIGAGLHYPKPLHLTEAFAEVAEPGSYPVAEAEADTILTLPLFPHITEAQQTRVVETLVEALFVTLDPTVQVHEKGLCETDAVGPRTRIWAFAHLLPGSVVGSDCNICDGAFIDAGARIGDRVTVKNSVLVWDRVTVEDDVFLGPAMIFTNDYVPRAFIKRGADAFLPTLVRRGATVGANATVVCGVTIGEYAIVGAGAVVTRDVPAFALVVGSPARFLDWVCACGERLGEALECSSCGRTYERTADGGVALAPGVAGA